MALNPHTGATAASPASDEPRLFPEACDSSRAQTDGHMVQLATARPGRNRRNLAQEEFLSSTLTFPESPM